MRYVFLFIVCLFLIQEVQAKDKNYSFNIEYESLRGSLLNKVKKYSWKNNCPVNLSDLILLKVSYWGFDNQPHVGEIIVHRASSPEVILIFKELFDKKFPIKSIIPMYKYYGDDKVSMLENNTVAYNCRIRTNYTNKFSQHSYGIAIDINPFTNPYYKNGSVIPASARKNLSRKKNKKGIIKKGNSCYRIFKKKGWTWGGDWRTLKDYQHFEKDLSLYKKEKKYSLLFNNLPDNTEIKIMNILKTYRTSRFLSRGYYDVKIISDNKEKRFWVLVDRNRSINYNNLE